MAAKGKQGGKPAAKDDMEVEEGMQALVLTDVFDQTAFAPLSLDGPVALLPLANIPLIEYTLQALANQADLSEIVLFSAKHPAELRTYLSASRWRHHVVPGGAGSAAARAGAGGDGAPTPSASSSSSSAPAALATPRIRIVTAPGVASSGDALRAVDAMSLIRSDTWLLVDGPGWLSNAHLGAAVASHAARNKADTNAVMTVLLARVPGEPSPASALRGDARRVTRLSMTPHDGKIHGYDVLDAAEALASPKALTAVPSKIARAEPAAVARTDLLDTRAYVCSGAVLVHFSDNYDYGAVRDAYLHGEVLNVDMGFAFHGHVLADAFAAPIDSLAAMAAASREIARKRVHAFTPSANWAEDAAAALGGRSEHLRAPWRVGGVTREALVQEGAAVAASARLIGPVIVGAGASIGDGAVLEGAVVVGPGAVIGAGARIRDAIIMAGAAVGAGAVLGAGAIVGAGAVIGDKAVVGAGAVIGAGVHVPAGHAVPAHARVTAAALPAGVSAAAAAACNLPAGGKGRLWPAPGEDGEDEDEDGDDESEEEDDDEDEAGGKAGGAAGADGSDGAARAAAAGAAAAALSSALAAYRTALAAYRAVTDPAAAAAEKVALARTLTALTAAVRAALAHRRLCVGPALEPLWPALSILLTPLAAATGAAAGGAGVATLAAPMSAKEASDVLASAASAASAKPGAPAVPAAVAPAAAAAAAATPAAGGAGAGSAAAAAADAAAAAVQKFRRFATGVADLLCGRSAAAAAAAAAAGDAASAGGAGAGASSSAAALRPAVAASPDIVRNLTMEVKSFKYAEHASFGDCVHAVMAPVIEAIPGAPPAPGAPDAAVKGWYVGARAAMQLWAPLLSALVNSTGDEMAVLLALEQYVLRAAGDRAAALHPLFGLLLQLLYDEDVVSDIAVQAWAFSAEDEEEEGDDEEEAEEEAKRAVSAASGGGAVVAKSATTIDGAMAAASTIYGVKLTGPEAKAARAGLLKGKWTQRLLEKLEEEEDDDDEDEEVGEEEGEE